MSTPAAEPRTTPEGSPSPTSNPSSSTPSGVRSSPLGVRPTPSTNMASAPAPSPAGEPAADRQGPADPLDTATPSEYDAPAPGPDAKPLKLKDKPLAEVIRGLVLAATVLIHQSLARTPEELEAGVWLAGEDEASGISDPLAKVANRHAGGLAVNPDTGDLIAAGVAAAGYLVSNAMRAFQIRRAVAKHRRAGIPAQPTEGAAE